MTALQDLLEETKECHHSLLKQLFANCPVEVLQHGGKPLHSPEKPQLLDDKERSVEQTP